MKSNLLFLLFLVCMGNINAQLPIRQPGDTNTYVITKTNGTEYIGKILSDDGREILVQTENLGKIYIPKADVRSIIAINDAKSVIRGEYRASGPFTTRHALRQTFRRYDATADEIRNIFKLSVSKYIEEL